MTPFECYQRYLAIQRHFNSNYDAFKYHFKTNVKRETFEKRNDRYFFHKVLNQVSDEEINEYFAANFIAGVKWIGEIVQNRNVWTEYKKNKESLFYQFNCDLDHLLCINNMFDDILLAKDGEYPIIVNEYLSNKVSLQTVTIIHKLTNFLNNADVNDPLLWPDIKNKVVKYSPFLEIDKQKYTQKIIQKYTD